MNDQDPGAIMTIAVMAAGADGSQSSAEQAQLEAIAARGGVADFQGVAKQIAAGQIRLAEVVRRLSDQTARQQAYETALLVCNADGPANEREKSFLAELQTALGVSATTHAQVAEGIYALTAAPIAAASSTAHLASEAALEELILQQAMLTGALEILPDHLATLAILPLQLRLVYQVGQQYGQTLDADQIKDLAGTLGIGAAAQMVEGMVRKVLGGLTSGLLGGSLGGVTGIAAGATVSFASTYALGHVAKQYYAQGRQLKAGDLKTLFARFQNDARSLLPKVQDQIQRLAGTLNLKDVISQFSPP
jgi:uncharacterized protein (DUF697 family)/tellurite resistance protein